jgi:hypothetical protein
MTMLMNNVILHVVYNNDLQLKLTNGRKYLPLQLQNRVPPNLYGRYHQMVFGNQSIIPCEASIGYR